MLLRNLFSISVFAFVVWMAGSPPALAACTVPNSLTNGQTADATQVMGNFNAVTGCANAISPTTNGQVTIGSTGSAPVVGNLTAGTGISIANGPGSITIANTATGGGMVLVEEHTASNSATLDFTTGITSAYDVYELDYTEIVPANTTVGLELLFSTDGGSTWISSGYRLATTELDSTNGAYNHAQNNNDVNLRINPSDVFLAAGTSIQLSGRVRLHALLNASLNKIVLGEWASYFGGGVMSGSLIGSNTSTTAVNAIRIQMSSGNITSGVVRLYGLAK